MEEINYQAVITQYQYENERLRRKLAKKYISLPPLIDEVRWFFQRITGKVDKLSPEKVVIYSIALSVIVEIARAAISYVRKTEGENQDV